MLDRSLIDETATSLVARLRSGEIRPHDLLDALETRIAEVDPAVNALPTLCFARARAAADRLMRLPVEERGLLAGLPVPIKDLTNVEGVRSTQGSLIFKDHIPDHSDIMVEHLEAEGAIIYAKSNTPEFGAGGNTFNEVFGVTRNPYDTSRSAAGSSGGAAVALKTGMAWLAQGSDMGGSLRNPASFNGIVGMRPSMGRVAADPGVLLDNTLSTEGPMARNVADLALFLDAMSGVDIRDPLSLPRPPVSFSEGMKLTQRPRRVAFSRDLGITPVDPEVAAIVEGAARRLEKEGVIVEEAHPDLSPAHECFQVLRALSYAVSKAHLLEHHKDQLKPEVIWNIEQGLKLSATEIARAQALRALMYERTLSFFTQYDLLLTPATIVAAYPAEQRYVAECNGHRFDNYVEWLAIAYAITLVFCPALSLPCGFTTLGLPVGMQVVGPPRAEAQVLAGAAFIESLLGLDMTPIEPKMPR
ncbi:amidase [Arboricoccus pini]|uniref:Amidase n=1 Tax=Arboricoccus pini TaxID=1963835 RepID=A0A212QQI7_9PROT|nr:amidase family protein [Arboricoccus pini]SNB61586.1 amidase [Arboricoccus pini]